MPKKHQPAFLSIKPSAASSTPQNPARATPPQPTPPRSVNDRITQLRREQAPRASPQRINEVAEVVSHRTVPPHLRRLLHLPEVDAPRPKRNFWRHPNEEAAAGPAVPSSWLSRSRHAPRRLSSRDGVKVRSACRFCRLAEIHDAEYKRLPAPRSLVHYALRSFAINWEELAEYERYYIPTLPTYLKEALLSYLSVYGNAGCLDYKSFKTLFQSDSEMQDASDLEEVRFLDLTGLLSSAFTLRDLEKSLQRPHASATITSSMEALSLRQSTAKGDASPSIADSWEDETEASAPLPPNIHTPFFPNLTRLSLAHPGPSASWASLLALSPHLNTLTHLSLAYWPRPSTTPNAATASMVAQHATVSLGGSHFYSDLDDDWHEAANVLRRLALNTYCLTYLDLEGCTWLKALVWGLPFSSLPGPAAAAAAVAPPNYYDAEDGWPAAEAVPGPDWNTAWRRVERVNVFQGWVPADRKSLQGMPAGVVAVELMRWLRDDEKRRGMEHVLDSSRRGWEVVEWVEREKTARGVVAAVQRARREAGGLWLGGEYGWGE